MLTNKIVSFEQPGPDKLILACPLKNFKRKQIFLEPLYKHKALLRNVQKTRNVTPFHFDRTMLFEMFTGIKLVPTLLL